MNAALHDPWTFQEGDLKDEDGAPYGSFVSVVNSAGDPILWSDSESPEFEARFRLIAAAPELLEALQGVLRVADRKTDEFDAARAAIAKALGETT